MMARIISQTQDAIDRLRKAGFKRGEYSTKTARDKNGEYAAYPKICLHLRRPFTGQDAVNLLANGFDLLWVWTGETPPENEQWRTPLVTDREYGEPARIGVLKV